MTNPPTSPLDSLVFLCSALQRYGCFAVEFSVATDYTDCLSRSRLFLVLTCISQQQQFRSSLFTRSKNVLANAAVSETPSDINLSQDFQV
jgi:hypothetical protein